MNEPNNPGAPVASRLQTALRAALAPRQPTALDLAGPRPGQAVLLLACGPPAAAPSDSCADRAT